MLTRIFSVYASTFRDLCQLRFQSIIRIDRIFTFQTVLHIPTKMDYTVVGFIGFVIIWKAAGMSAASTVSEAFKQHQVVPDVIPVAPTELLDVTYEANLKPNLGNKLTPTQVKNQPAVKWDSADSASFYTLCMTDPDAPSRADPKYREWHHWLVGNVPGGDVAKGETLSQYVGSGPPPDTGFHRYVFLVYKQPQKLTFDEPRLTNRSGDNRANFKMSKFAEKYKLGNPIAGNFYQAEYDDYVPTLYKQLGA